MKARAYGGGVRAVTLVFSLVMLGLAFSVLAGNFSASSSSSPESGSSSQELVFTVTNDDLASNITEINITIPSAFSFIEGSNSTSASETLFSNSSDNVTWENTTSQGFIGTALSRDFRFNVSVPAGTSSYNYTVTTLDTSGAANATNVTITVQDATDPDQVTLVSPENNSWVSDSYALLNFSYSELNPSGCSYDNGTVNLTNSTASSPCYIYLDSLPEGTWSYWLYVNDTSGNYAMNGTYSFRSDRTDPSINDLGIFSGGSNLSGSTITTRQNITVSANVTDPVSGPYHVWAEVYHETEGLTDSFNLSGSGDIYNGTWQALLYYNGSGNYSVVVNATDSAGNTPPAGQISEIEFLGAPDLQVSSILWTSDNPVSGHPNSGNNVTLNITLTNSGDEDFTEDINVTIKVGSSYPPSVIQNRSLIDNSSLGSGSSTSFNVTFNATDFPADAAYYFLVQADPEDSVNESLNTNNDEYLNLTLGYNVSLVKANNGTGDVYAPQVAKGFHYTNITYTVHVGYANGDDVTGLNFSNNFTFSSNHGTESDSDLEARNAIVKESEGSGNYVFNFTVIGPFDGSDGDIVPYLGDGQLTVSVENGSFSGSSDLDYNITSPKLTVYIDIDNTVYSGSDFSHDFNVTITNNGNARATGIAFNEDDSWRYKSFISYIDQDTSITNDALDPGQSRTYPQTGDLAARIVAAYTGSTTLELWVNYTDTMGTDFIEYDKDNFDAESGSSEEEDEGTTSGTTTGGDTNVEFELTLTDWDDEIQGYPGESNTTRVEVKNTGDLTAVVKVSFTCTPVGNAAIAPTSKSVAINDRQEFVIGLDIDPEAEIGSYDCKVKAYVSTSEEDFDEETLVLKVLPTHEAAEKIMNDFENMTAEVDDLMERFSSINPALVNDTNLTRVENLMNNANQTIESIREFIEDGDLLSAKELMDTLQASLFSTESALEELEMEQTRGGGTALSGTWFWVIIIIVIVIAGAFVAYMFFPQKGYGPKKGILDTIVDTFRGGGSKVGKLGDSGKSKLGGLTKKEFKPKSLASGAFKKQKSFAPGQNKGIITKIKEKLKRKKNQKEVTQYFASSSSNLINYSQDK